LLFPEFLVKLSRDFRPGSLTFFRFLMFPEFKELKLALLSNLQRALAEFLSSNISSSQETLTRLGTISFHRCAYFSNREWFACSSFELHILRFCLGIKL